MIVPSSLSDDTEFKAASSPCAKTKQTHYANAREPREILDSDKGTKLTKIYSLYDSPSHASPRQSTIQKFSIIPATASLVFPLVSLSATAAVSFSKTTNPRYVLCLWKEMNAFVDIQVIMLTKRPRRWKNHHRRSTGTRHGCRWTRKKGRLVEKILSWLVTGVLEALRRRDDKRFSSISKYPYCNERCGSCYDRRCHCCTPI